ncbi:hypothetical protein U1Q18_042157 [Sarracenia purpurea var. burkii]
MEEQGMARKPLNQPTNPVPLTCLNLLSWPSDPCSESPKPLVWSPDLWSVRSLIPGSGSFGLSLLSLPSYVISEESPPRWRPWRARFEILML